MGCVCHLLICPLPALIICVRLALAGLDREEGREIQGSLGLICWHFGCTSVISDKVFEVSMTPVCKYTYI